LAADTQKHYVIVPSIQRFRNWAMDNIRDEEWSHIGSRIHTATKEYRAVTAMHHLRGCTLTPETIHWADGWFMGLSNNGAIEMEQYVEMCLAAGPIK
jgi:hypothetical protein